ncbi:hypothetical protein GCM10022390_130 [Flavobacterium anseonense]
MSNYAIGCSCIGKSSIKKEVKHRDVILVGKIISQNVYEEKDSLINNFTFKKAEYKILVIEKLKGEIKTDTVSFLLDLAAEIVV